MFKSVHILFSLLSALFFVPVLQAQPTTFSSIFDVSGPGGYFEDIAEQVLCLDNGDFMVLSYSRYPHEVYDFIVGLSLVKLDAEGNLIWKKLYKSPNEPHFLYPAQLGLLPLEDGGFMLAGSNYTEHNNEDMFLMRLDSEGNELWFKRHGGSQWERGRNVGILQGEGENILFLSERGIYNNLPTWDIYLVNFDKNGSLLWHKTIGGDQFERSVGFAKDKDGGLLIGGHSRSAPAEINGDGILIKTDKTGNVLWQKIFGGSRADGAVIAKPTVFTEGYYAATYTDTLLLATQESPTIPIFYRLDSQGEVVWEHFFAAPQFIGLFDFVELEDGSIILVGFDENVPQIPDEENVFIIREAYGWMAKLSPEGELLWEKHYYDDRAITPVMSFRDVELTEDGGLVMTGQIWNRDSVYVEEVDSTFIVLNRDIWVVKTDLDGCLHPDCGENEVIYLDVPKVNRVTLEEIPTFQVFPNPTRHTAQLYFPNTTLLKGKETALEVFDLQGKFIEKHLLKTNASMESFYELEVSDWKLGMYLLQLKVDGTIVENRRLVVE